MRAITNLFLCLLTLIAANRAHAYRALIIDDLKNPIPYAVLLVGYGVNDPFPDNQLQANGSGVVEIPDSWDAQLPITITSPGYIKTTYFGANDLNTFMAGREEMRETFEVKGETQNFGDLKRDGKVDFALVYPSFRLNQLARFDVTSVLSLETDIIKVAGREFGVPSNISLPQQTENYIIPITLDKLTYRANFKQKGQYRMAATRGQFPLKQVVDELRSGKSFFDVVKYFRFLGGGDKDLSITGPSQGNTISVGDFSFDQKKISRAPAELPENTHVLSLSVNERDGYYAASDLKILNAGQSVDLVYPSRTSHNVTLSVLLTKDDANRFRPSTQGKSRLPKRLQNPENPKQDLAKFDPLATAAFLFSFFQYSKNFEILEKPSLSFSSVSIAQHAENSEEPIFLQLIERPRLENLVVYGQVPNSIAGIEPVATRAVLYEVEEVTRNDRKIVITYRIWEGTERGWVNQIAIPSFAAQLDPKKKHKLEIFYTGRAENNKKREGEYVLDDVTHVTRNSISL